ncbi:MAG: hypothetical protein Q8909_16920 [Bacteroidota bacterium]|nr:hypothetical protein [Bacteroidota bacterium]
MKKADKKNAAQLRELSTAELKKVNGGTTFCMIIDGKKIYITI